VVVGILVFVGLTGWVKRGGWILWLPLVTSGYLLLPVVTFAVKLESSMVVEFNRWVKREGIHIVDKC